MDITPLISKTSQIIESYGGGGFTVAGKRYAHSLLVFPEETLTWEVSSSVDFSAGSFGDIIERARDIDILLVGTGKAFTPLLPSVREALRPHGIAADAMDTGAACRTFNILLLEGRKVAAALIAV